MGANQLADEHDSEQTEQELAMCCHDTIWLRKELPGSGLTYQRDCLGEQCSLAFLGNQCRI